MSKTMKHAEDVELTSEELMKQMNESEPGGVVEGSTIRWHKPADLSDEELAQVVDRRLLGVLSGDVDPQPTGEKGRFYSRLDDPAVRDAQRRASADMRAALDKMEGSVDKATADIRATLDGRAKTHGDYGQHAAVTQMLKHIMHAAPNWPDLKYHEQETLEMVAHKIGRILCGDPHHHDHWHDIVGYATLSADRNR